MSPDRLSITFSALADPTRRAILARLISGEASVTELAEPFEMSMPAVSKHLKVLERAGLIARGRDEGYIRSDIDPVVATTGILGEIYALIHRLQPFDALEARHRSKCLGWLRETDDVFAA